MLIEIARLLVIVGLSFVLYNKQEGILKRVYWYAWSWKILAGLAVGYVYHYYYSTGDTFYFLADANTIASIIKTDLLAYFKFLCSSESVVFIDVSMEPRTLFFTKLLSVVSILAGTHYWVVSVYCSCLAFFGAWYLVSTIHQTSSYGIIAVIAFLFLPVENFWSAGIQKEVIVMPCLFFVAACVWQLWKRGWISLTQWLGVILALYVCWRIKYFYVGVAVPVVVTSFIYYLLQSRWKLVHNLFAKISLWMIIGIIPMIVVMGLHPNLHPTRVFAVIIENYHAFVAITEARNLTLYPNLAPTVEGIVYSSPKALITAFFRPFFWEATTVLQLLVSFENTIIVIMAVIFLWNFKFVKVHHDRLLIFTMLLYSIVVGILLALSTPSIGTLIRFRVGFMPFSIFVFLIGNPYLSYIQQRLHANAKNQL
jgi:hypothetical protein